MRETVGHVLPNLTEAQREQFVRYYELLTEWNARVNLTAITEKEAVAKKHFYDSLLAAPLIPQGAKCIDVGTGAGFPGVPLLIARPDISMTLLDSQQKRLRFLQALLSELHLSATLVHARAEDAGRDKAHRAAYDIALSRAVAPLPLLAELTVPLIKVGGMGIAYKGDPAAEMESAKAAQKTLFFTMETVECAADYGARALILMKKTCDTPRLYPRRAGLASKSPL